MKTFHGVTASRTPQRGALRRSLLGWAAFTAALVPAAPAWGAPPCAPPLWVGAWAASPKGVASTEARDGTAAALTNQTVRMIVHTTYGGSEVRVRVANTFGDAPLRISAATAGLRQSGATLVAGSARPLMFAGAASVTLNPGFDMLSDPVALDVPAAADVAISLYVPDVLQRPTQHPVALQTSFLTPSGAGDHTADEGAGVFPLTTRAWLLVTGLDVLASTPGSAIVTLGDSITDGGGSMPDTNRRWPDVLAGRILARPAGQRASVLNAGIGGNRILSGGTNDNPSALNRLDRDVFSQTGVRDVILLEGTNDIVGGSTSAAIITGMQEIITRAHARELRVLGGTIIPIDYTRVVSPWTLGKSNPAANATRRAVNDWIRTPGAFDGVVDFDAAVRDPNARDRMLAAYTADGIHPNDAGYRAMGEAVPLELLDLGCTAAA
ncbi:MAG: SGNH/GDSL hydrolase family protein [Acidobacteria bacterium]|nr:SGNH/GDSL hydrolase family protein [Acidobacteriota bacterium]